MRRVGHIMMDKVCDDVNEITSIKERFAVNMRKEIKIVTLVRKN